MNKFNVLLLYLSFLYHLERILLADGVHKCRKHWLLFVSPPPEVFSQVAADELTPCAVAAFEFPLHEVLRPLNVLSVDLWVLGVHPVPN